MPKQEKRSCCIVIGHCTSSSRRREIQLRIGNCSLEMSLCVACAPAPCPVHGKFASRVAERIHEGSIETGDGGGHVFHRIVCPPTPCKIVCITDMHCLSVDRIGCH